MGVAGTGPELPETALNIICNLIKIPSHVYVESSYRESLILILGFFNDVSDESYNSKKQMINR